MRVHQGITYVMEKCSKLNLEKETSNIFRKIQNNKVINIFSFPTQFSELKCYKTEHL